jgi:hypothetical protein
MAGGVKTTGATSSQKTEMMKGGLFMGAGA